MSKRIGRNKPCPCGSGKKYKHCCLSTDQDKLSPAMPGSPRQHELNREAVEYIRSKLPNRWPREEVQNDYGIDLRVEIHENYQVTGLKFEIQSKGHERYRIVHSNQIAQPLKVSTLNYYANSLLPVLLIVYNAQGKQAHYLWVKPYIKEVLDKEKPHWHQREGDSEITLHIPLMNVFDETVHHDILTHVETETVRLLRQEEMASFSTSYRRKVSAIQLVTSPRLVRPKITNYLFSATP